MSKVWFFIANPRDDAKWQETKESNWLRNEGHITWGIPDKSRDINNLNKVDKEDVILCYHAYDREIIGCCRCKHEPYIDNEEEDGYSHRIDISEINFRNPIGLDELKQIGFEFIKEYLNFPRGRSVVHVPRDDWEKFKKIWVGYRKC